MINEKMFGNFHEECNHFSFSPTGWCFKSLTESQKTCFIFKLKQQISPSLDFSCRSFTVCVVLPFSPSFIFFLMYLMPFWQVWSWKQLLCPEMLAQTICLFVNTKLFLMISFEPKRIENTTNFKKGFDGSIHRIDFNLGFNLMNYLLPNPKLAVGHWRRQTIYWKLLSLDVILKFDKTVVADFYF